VNVQTKHVETENVETEHAETKDLNELLTELSRQGVQLWTEDDQLRVRAPKGVLTPELRSLLSGHKADLLRLLRYRGEAVDLSLPQIEPAPEDRYRPFPLNDIQQAYWVGRTGGVELGNVTTHAYMEFERRELDVDRLSTALQKLVERHDMLRAVVLPTGEQQVLERVPRYEIAVLDLGDADAGEVEAGLTAVRGEMSHQILSLDRWPLFEIRATRLPEGRVRIHFSIDLMITDFGSLLLLFKEWAHFYRDPDRPLPALEVTFRDFILTERQLERTELYKRAEKYWIDRLDTLPPRPQLPLARNPSEIVHPRFHRRDFVLPAPRWRKLEERAREAGLTSSGLLLAAFAEVLDLWSQSPRFTINLTQYNRLPLHPQVNDVVGNSISVVLLAVDNTTLGSFLERARRLQKRLWQDLDHTTLSGVRVLRELVRKQGHNRSAIMPVVFTSILGLDALGKGADSGELGEVVYTISQTPQVWLDHQVLEEEGALHTSWDTVEDLFPPGLIDDMFAVYRRLLERLAAGEEAWAERTPCRLPERQVAVRGKAVRDAVNDTGAPVAGELLHTLFEARVEERGEAPAVISPGRTLSYRELAGIVNRLGRWLRRAGAVPERPVAVVMEKGWEQVAAALGILTAGAPYMPLDPALPPRRLRSLLERGEVELALTQSHLDAGLEWPEGVERLAVDAADLSAFDPGPLAPVQRPDQLAYVLFTSGSTGEPKGVMLDHRGPLNTVTHFNQRFGVGPEDRALALSALNFDLSVYDLFGLLAAGGALVVPDPAGARDPERWVELMAEHRVTVWNSVPTLMKMMVEFLAGDPERTPPGFRLVVMSGDWIPVELPDRIRALWPGIEVVGAGGPTETSIWNVCYPIGTVDPEWTSIPYGRPTANNRYHVLDRRLEPRPDWVAGELVAAGVGLARGYWRDPAATAERFVVHPESGERLYRTGDLGRHLPDGTLEILGRVDFQVKIDGFRIELGEVESALREHPEVRDAVVTAVGAERAKKQLAAYVVPVHGVPGDGVPGDGVPGNGGAPGSGSTAGPAAGGFSPVDEADAEGVLVDPAERVEHKLSQPGLRRWPADHPGVELPGGRSGEEGAGWARHSARRYLPTPVPLELLGRFLACLGQRVRDDDPLPKYLYPSAGSLYPVQAYLHVKAGRVESLEGGSYYYDPAGHRLVPLEPGARIDGAVHAPHNREMFEQAAFSIFLVGKLGAVIPIYGRRLARELCTLEAGYVGQLLMRSASEGGLGVCPIGALDFGAVRGSFRLDDDHLLLHSLVGGLEAPAESPAAGRGRDDLGEELRGFLRDKLPEYMVPALYLFLEALPLSANNKVDRKALPDPESARSRAETEAVPPRNELERTLERIVSEVLERESVGIHGNFFELGANSVDVVRIHGRLRETLGLDLPVVDFFRRPTISFLAEYLSEGEDEEVAFERLEQEAGKRKSRREKKRRRGRVEDVLKDGV